MSRTTYAPCPAPAPAQTAVPLDKRCWSGCGLPCEDKVSMWHVRLVGGWPFFFGTDDPDPCSYWGVDLGRTHCGCWGYDLYYRMSGARFPRTNDPNGITKDGGLTHHLGGKLTYERSLGGGKFYWWGGLGAGYFWTSDYQSDDTGWEVYGELGVGYIISQNFRVRAGINAHGMDTEVGRKSPLDDGESRFLWIVAPVIQLEIDF